MASGAISGAIGGGVTGNPFWAGSIAGGLNNVGVQFSDHPGDVDFKGPLEGAAAGGALGMFGDNMADYRGA